MPRIIPRKDWNAARSRARLAVADTDRTGFMLHYSTGEELGRTDCHVWVREIQRYHQAKGWADIGYNFLVCRHGDIFEGRGWGFAGAHCPGFNVSAWGVCFLGDDDAGIRDITRPARNDIRRLYEAAQDRAGRRLDALGHRDGKNTSCPGDEGYRFVRSGFQLGVDIKPPRDRPSGSRPVSGPRVPPWPLRGDVLGSGSHLALWQRQMRRRGWRIAVDGRYGPQTEGVARSFQREKGLTVDGLIGARTWRAAWAAPIS